MKAVVDMHAPKIMIKIYQIVIFNFSSTLHNFFVESNKTERKRIDLSSFNAQNPSYTKEETADLKIKALLKLF